MAHGEFVPQELLTLVRRVSDLVSAYTLTQLPSQISEDINELLVQEPQVGHGCSGQGHEIGW